MSPRRVLHLATCPFPTPGGTQVYIRQLATHLALAGHDLHLVTYGLGDHPDLAAFDAAEPYRLHRAPPVPGHTRLAAGPSAGRVAADALLLLTALHAARAHGPFDLIHAHNYEGAIAGIVTARLTGLPLLYHAHNLMADELPTYARSPHLRAHAQRLGLALDHHVPHRADAIVTVSRHAADALARHTHTPITFLPPAIDLGPPPTTTAPPTDAIYCGNLDGYQDPDVLFDALAHLGAQRALDFTLATAEPPHRWRPFAERLPPSVRLHLVPHATFDQVKAHLLSARVALLPRTVPSGFPIKLLNQLAAAVPTVAATSSAQGLTEADGVLTVPDHDPKALAHALAALLDDPERRHRAARAAQRTAARFGWPRHVEGIEEVYRQVMGAGG